MIIYAMIIYCGLRRPIRGGYRSSIEPLIGLLRYIKNLNSVC